MSDWDDCQTEGCWHLGVAHEADGPCTVTGLHLRQVPRAGGRMNAASRWEVVHSGPRAFHARLVAPNGEVIVWTETYTTRAKARAAIDLTILYATTIAAARTREIEEIS